jgi:hypothetical protein
MLYLNFTPPIRSTTVWGWIGVAVAFMLALIILFTGEIRRRKARLLFSIMYLMTFLSLAVPIATAILVAQSQYVIEVMEEAPIGLVKAVAPAVSKPQWLINIGGAVDRKRLQDQRVRAEGAAPVLVTRRRTTPRLPPPAAPFASDGVASVIDRRSWPYRSQVG